MAKNSEKSLGLISVIVFFSSIISSFGFLIQERFEAENLNLFGSDRDFNLESIDNAKDQIDESSDFLTVSYYNPPPDTSDSLNSQLSSDSLNLSGIVDTIAVDSMVVDSMAIDSTARLKYFRYQREDIPYTRFRPQRKKSFFVYPSGTSYQRTARLDSTGQFVIITETIAGQEIKPGLKIPLDVYIKLKLKAMKRDEWEQLGYKYELLDSEKNLEDLLTDITNIDIPLPKTSFLSIFGPNRIQLRINGAVDIHGAWRSETTEGLTVSRLGNTRNEPDFKQQVQINVSGTIGDKLNIAADWSTERTFEYENQLKLKYTGYEDEIVQSVEAGNVSLQTSSLVGGSEALFGIKSEFQFGPFNLTALASQKKGEIQEKSITGGATTNDFSIRAYQYSENHFFLDDVYADTTELNIFNQYFGNPSPVTYPEYEVLEVEVWKSTSGRIEKGQERRAVAHIELDPIAEGDNYGDNIRNANSEVGKIVTGRFRKLEEGVDYIIHPFTGFISMLSNVQDNEALAVAYRIHGETGTDEFYGEFLRTVPSDTSQTIVLKLVKPPNLKPGGNFQQAWNLMLKNIYPIGGRDIKEEGFTLDITYTEPGEEPKNYYQNTKLLQAFGLDKVDETGAGNPDGAFDYYPGRTILPQTGEIIFPVLQPFGKNFPKELPSVLKFQKVYDTLKTFAQQAKDLDRFVIEGEYSAATSAVHSIGFNVVENSVKVYLNGQELTPGVDYAVDYNIGQITIRNDNALIPGADLRITYEQNDLFQLASKTLLGLRGLYDFNEKTKLGFSVLNLNQKTLSDKVRIGEEPISNSIYGLDFQTGFDLPFITSGLDYLISTKEQSSLNLKGEFAYINPDPNTKKSPINGDNNESIAYVDDFEGAKRIIPITIAYQAWNDLSAPDSLPAFTGQNLTKEELMAYKAKTYWFNFLPYSGVKVEDIWPEKQAAREDENVQVLELVYDPTQKGSFNWNPTIDNTAMNWGGMMKKLSSTANNLVAENIEFIEFWLNVADAPQGSKFYIDLGKISEDVIPFNTPDINDRNRLYGNELHTEDFNGNDLVDEGEDLGLDMLADSEEPGYDPTNNPDPSGDNIRVVQGSLNREDYINVNGTQGNAALISGNIPDTEDLDRNSNLDKITSYYRYEVPLDTNKTTNPLIAGGGDNSGWYQFRIPLRDFQEAIGDPSFTDVDMIRIFFNGVESLIHLRIVDFNLVGNQWQKVLVPNKVTEDDETLVVSTISVEENPEYVPPSDNLRERDRTKPDQEVYKNEQSLKLSIKNLQDGDNRKIIKYLYRPLDIFNYKELKLFLHGDVDDLPGSVSYYENENNYGSEVFLRFGSDTANFYEYRQPLKSGWQNMHIIFSELTAIKQTRPDEKVLFQVPVEGEPGHTYGVQGNPSLTRVNFFMIGVKNPRQGNSIEGDEEKAIIVEEPVSGDIWVNEMRVLSAEDQDGWAYSMSGSANFADLFSVNANLSQSNPYFHKLADRFGNRIDAKNWGVSVNFDLLKLVPFNTEGSNLKLNYSRTESINKPLFKPGTDIKVDEAAQQLEEQLISEGFSEENAKEEAQRFRTETQTVNISDTWSLSGIKFNIPTDSWYLKETINRLTFGFNYNKSMGRNPTTSKIERWVWNASARYNVNFSSQNFFYPADIPVLGNLFKIFNDYEDVKIFYSPQSFNSTLSANRRRSYSQSRDEELEPNIQRDFTTSRDAGFNWKLTEGGFFNLTTDYSVTVSSSLTHLLTAAGVERSEQAIWNDILTRAFFGKIYDYKQSVDVRSAPKLPSLWNVDKYFTLNAGYGVSYNWRNNFNQEEIGRSAGYSNRISADMNLRLKSLVAPLFASDTKSSQKPGATSGVSGRGRGRRERGEANPEILPEPKTPSDSTAAESQEDEGPKGLSRGLLLLKGAVKWLLFDYDQISIRFSQNNSFSGSGLKAESTGFSNFWGLTQKPEMGPNRLFMLGLSNDIGPRVAIPKTNLSDNFSQKNDISLSTSRPLWENAQIDLDWKVGWGLNKSTTYNVDDNGELVLSNIRSTGSLDRSFLALPSFLFISGGIVKVNELYDPDSPDPTASLSNAFVEGFETFPIFAKLPLLKDLAKYIPRPNWRFNWSGLEKISFFKGFAKRVTLSHAYSSSYNEGWRINPDGEQEIQSQRIESGFSPLLGLNITFNELWDGNLTGSIKYNTRNSFSLGASTRNITEQFSRDINVSASFSKSGFSLPFFGLSLKNDIEMSLSYTSGKNSTVLYEMNNFNEEGEPQDGTTRTVIEPRIKYVMSSRVTLSIFYKRTSISPEGAARIPPSTTNEAGLDVRIAIQ